MENAPRPLAPRTVPGKASAAHRRHVLGRSPNFTFLVLRFSLAIVSNENDAILAPRLVRFRHIPGVKGVKPARSEDGVRVGDPQIALQNLSGDMVVLPHAGQPGGRTWSAFGHEGLDYVVGYENARGGRHYVPFWTRPIAGTARVEIDYKARSQFLAWAREIAGEPHQTEVAALKASLEFQALSLAEGARRNAAKASKLAAIQRQLTAFNKPVQAPPVAPVASVTVSMLDVFQQQAAMIAALEARLNSLLNAKPNPVADSAPSPEPAPVEDEGEDESEVDEFDLGEPRVLS